MSSLADIRQALAERIEIAGLRVHHRPPADTTGNEFPCAVIRAFGANFTTTFGGSATDSPMDAEVVVTVLVNSGESEEALMQLEEYLNPNGPKSVVAAVNSEQALLPDVAAAVIGYRNVGFREELGQLYGADLIVRLIKGN